MLGIPALPRPTSSPSTTPESFGESFFFFLRFYLFILREKGREGKRERNIDMREKHWLPFTCTLTEDPQPR